MSDKMAEYIEAGAPLPAKNRIWPLYGSGMENLGKDRQPIEVPMPAYGPDEMLARHDTCSVCFSDVKVMRQGQSHPRIYRDMQAEPVVLGHEVSLTIVAVGENLRDQYRVGDRFIVQADIFVDGVGYAYGYEIQGGFSEYTVIDQRILNGDDGNYLIPVQPDTGYSEGALVEPWACVIAAYRLEYRTGLKPGGTAWVIGAAPKDDWEYTIGAGFDAESHPARLLLTGVPSGFAAWLKERAESLGVEVVEVADLASPPVEEVDDIVVLGADIDVIETVSPHLAKFGIVAVIDDAPPARKMQMDMGRVHYNRWVYVGGAEPDIARAYSRVPVRASLKSGGKALFVGAGGPMGRMHVQRALQVEDGPAVVVCTDVSDERLDDLCTSFAGEAEAGGIEFICLNPQSETYKKAMADLGGFDDIVVLAPIPAVIEEAADYLAPRGVMNVFAGVGRGTMAALDVGAVYLEDKRFIGHSASSIDDMRAMLAQTESGALAPNRVVAAVGSLEAFWDGLKAVRDAEYPGKIVIYPHIQPLPLTTLPELKEKLPAVYAELAEGRDWTVAAERALLREMLP